MLLFPPLLLLAKTLNHPLVLRLQPLVIILLQLFYMLLQLLNVPSTTVHHLSRLNGEKSVYDLRNKVGRADTSVTLMDSMHTLSMLWASSNTTQESLPRLRETISEIFGSSK